MWSKQRGTHFPRHVSLLSVTQLIRGLGSEPRESDSRIVHVYVNKSKQSRMAQPQFRGRRVRMLEINPDSKGCLAQGVSEICGECFAGRFCKKINKQKPKLECGGQQGAL